MKGGKGERKTRVPDWREWIAAELVGMHWWRRNCHSHGRKREWEAESYRRGSWRIIYLLLRNHISFSPILFIYWIELNERIDYLRNGGWGICLNGEPFFFFGLSFVGKAASPVNVPTSYGRALWLWVSELESFADKILQLKIGRTKVDVNKLHVIL